MIHWELLPERIESAWFRQNEELFGLMTAISHNSVVQYPALLRILDERVFPFTKCDKSELQIFNGYIDILKPYSNEHIFRINLKDVTIKSHRFWFYSKGGGGLEFYFKPRDLGYNSTVGFIK